MTIFSRNPNGPIRPFWAARTSVPSSGRDPRRVPSTTAPSPSWKLYAAAILAAAAFFEILQWPLLPRSIDVHYHMAVANGFRLAGGYVAHAFWEHAPAGRPHLYPPLIHVVLLALRAAGLSAVDSARLVEVAVHPLTLFALWAAVRRFSSDAAAFFAVLVWASVHSAYAASFDFPAETFALVLGLGSLAAFRANNRPLAVLCLALTFYAHGLFSWTVLAAFLLNGWVSGRPKGAVLAAAAALLAASPILAHEFAHRGAFHFARVAEDARVEVDLTAVTLAAAAFVLTWRKKIDASAPLCLLVASLPLGFAYRTRLTGGHGFVAVAWLAALALEAAHARIASHHRAAGRLFLAASALWVALAGPLLTIDARGARFEWTHTTLSRQLFHAGKDARTAGLYDGKRVGEIVAAIREVAAPDEIFWADLRYEAALLSALSDRATSSAALEEVGAEKGEDPIAAAKAVVCFRENDGAAPRWAAPLAKRYGLERAAETDWAVIYRNPRPTPKISKPKPAVPSPVLFALMGAAALAAVLGFRASGKG